MARVDGDHLGPLANLAAWITLCVAFVLGVAKIFTKWRIASALYLDDGFMALSILFAIGTTVAVIYQVNFGLGQHGTTLDPSAVDSFLKALLATDVFYVLTIFSAKLSLVRYLKLFTREGRRRKAINCLLYLMMAWPVIAVLCICFRCPVPNTWDLRNERCADVDAFWTVNTVLDVVSQVIIALSPIALLYDIKISWTKKRLAIISYLPIVTTIPFEILRIVFIWRSPLGADIQYTSFRPVLFTVIHANFSVIASTSTFLIPIIEALSVGLISSQVLLNPSLEGPHKNNIRRAEPPFNPLSLLRGHSFLAQTHVTTGNSGNSKGNKSSKASKASKASQSSGGKRIGGILGRSVIDSIDVTLTESEMNYSSRDAMVIETTTSFEVRSGSESAARDKLAPMAGTTYSQTALP